jgi:hypothetical protein
MFYRTGTISLTNGSTAVTGAGTDFINGAAIGECIQAPDGKLYEILSIQSATALTLGQVYLGATASGQTYSIVPTQSYIRDLASQAATLVNDYATTNSNAFLITVADKATPVDTDRMAIKDVTTGLGKWVTLANVKSFLKTYFATLNGSETLTNKTITDPNIDGVKYLVTQTQLTFALDYAIDQAAMANKRVTDATTFQTQTGTASFTQSASTEMTRTYATATVTLPKAYKNTNYQVVIDPVSATPALGWQGEITVQSRSVNSFVLQMSGSATACSVRWKTLHPNAENRTHVVLPTAQ